MKPSYMIYVLMSLCCGIRLFSLTKTKQTNKKAIIISCHMHTVKMVGAYIKHAQCFNLLGQHVCK